MFGYTETDALTITERIQTLAATILVTHPVGHQLCLIGGFRYRLLNASARASADIDYHWEGALRRKQVEIVDVLRSRLPPEVKRQVDYDGAMVWDSVLRLLRDTLTKAKELSS
jgi:hypothetical protein